METCECWCENSMRVVWEEKEWTNRRLTIKYIEHWCRLQ